MQVVGGIRAWVLKTVCVQTYLAEAPATSALTLAFTAVVVEERYARKDGSESVRK